MKLSFCNIAKIKIFTYRGKPEAFVTDFHSKMAKGNSSYRKSIKERTVEHEGGERTMERAEIWMQSDWITRTLLAGMENRVATLESSLSVSYTTKDAITKGPRRCTLGHQRKKTFFPREKKLM